MKSAMPPIAAAIGGRIEWLALTPAEYHARTAHVPGGAGLALAASPCGDVAGRRSMLLACYLAPMSSPMTRSAPAMTWCSSSTGNVPGMR